MIQRRPEIDLDPEVAIKERAALLATAVGENLLQNILAEHGIEALETDEAATLAGLALGLPPVGSGNSTVHGDDEILRTKIALSAYRENPKKRHVQLDEVRTVLCGLKLYEKYRETLLGQASGVDPV